MATDSNHYLMKFRCANCGHQFEKEVRKGTPAHGQAGPCPNCGVRDNMSGVGHHQVIRDNQSDNPTGGRQVLMEDSRFPPGH
jgi:DNA-directed RNA polymerase subunit RPC12/RpoP